MLKINFYYGIIFCLLAGSLAGSGFPMGDLKLIFYVCETFFYQENQNKSFIELLNYPINGNNEYYSHRLLHFIITYMFLKISLVFSNILNFSNYTLISSVLITYFFSFLFFLSLFILERFYSKNNYSFIVYFLFLGSGLLIYANWQNSENLIIFFISLSLYFLNKKGLLNRSIFISFLFLIFCCKFYYVLVCLFLLVASHSKNNFNIKKLIIQIIIFLTICTFYYLAAESLSFEKERVLKEFNIATSPKIILINFLSMIFSFSHGLFFSIHIFLVLILFGLRKDNLSLIKYSMTLIYMLFFSSLPFWHGDGIGSRYLMPMVILYIPEILIGYKKVVNKLKIIPSLVLCLMLVAYIPSIDYRATSINRYLDGSSILMVSKENLYNEYNFPYYDLSFFNPYFSWKIVFAKVFNKENIMTNNDHKLLVPIENFYPRSLISKIIYVHKTNKYRDKKIHESLFKIIDNNILLPIIYCLNLFLYLLIFIIPTYFLIKKKEQN